MKAGSEFLPADGPIARNLTCPAPVGQRLGLARRESNRVKMTLKPTIALRCRIWATQRGPNVGKCPWGGSL